MGDPNQLAITTEGEDLALQCFVIYYLDIFMYTLTTVYILIFYRMG